MSEERYQHFLRPTSQRPPSAFSLSLLVLVVGAAAGFGGYLLARSIIPADQPYVYNSGSTGTIKIDADRPLANIAQKYQESVAGVYRAVSPVANLKQVVFSPADFLGSAVVVTSDGWLMTTEQVAITSSSLVALNDEIYKVGEIKKDSFTKTVFFKVEDDLLQPINFQLTDDVKTGEILFSNTDLPHNRNHAFYTGFVSNAHYVPDSSLFTDQLDYYLLPSISNQLETTGAPYFNLDGNLLGLNYQLNGTSLVLPAEYLRQAVKNLLNNTNRVVVGVHYLDLDNNSGFDDNGVLVYNPRGRAVEAGSPAAKAGLLSGDRIISVNNIAIIGPRSLTSLLQEYRPGDKVNFKIVRNGKERDIEVQL